MAKERVPPRQQSTKDKPHQKPKPLSRTEILKCEFSEVMVAGSQIHAALKQITDDGKTHYPISPLALSGDSCFVQHINNAVALLKEADKEASHAIQAWCAGLTPAQNRIIGPLVGKLKQGLGRKKAAVATAGQGVNRG